MKRVVLPSVVTAYNPDWESQIEELKKFGITQIGFFPTMLDERERHECCRKLEQVGELEIPFVHLRSDMKPSEVKYFIDRFKTKKFNIHPASQQPLIYDLSVFKGLICVENSGRIKEEDLKDFAGLCLDIAHLEDWRLKGDTEYELVCSLLKKYPVGVNHISAVKDKPVYDQSGDFGYSYHWGHLMNSFTEFEYLSRYPEDYFGEYLAVELTNSISDQLKLIEYLQRRLSLLS